jgi:3-oxoacyl-[acyl-carrier-protein] synthase II
VEPRRVVVTGIGVLNGPSVGAQQFWERLNDPHPGPTATLIQDFDARRWMDRRQARRSDVFAHLAVASACLAMEDAGEPELDPDRTGVVIGAGNGGTGVTLREYEVFKAEGPDAVSPLMGAVTMSNAASSNIAFRLGLRGPCESTASGCASGTHAVGNAARLVRWGVCDAVVTGGADAPRSQEAERGAFVSAALKNLRVHTEDDLVRPFDVKRSGFTLADGAASLLLEERDAALARGARIYAEVVGYGNTLDGYDLIAPEPSGEGVRRCMQAALDEAGATGADVRFVNTHGTATRSNDLAETNAIRDLCGLPGPAVNSIKGTTGHSGPAAGALEAASVALSIHHRTIPPTAGLEEPSPEIEVDLVYGEPRAWEPGLSLSTSLGLGGHTGCLAFAPA